MPLPANGAGQPAQTAGVGDVGNGAGGGTYDNSALSGAGAPTTTGNNGPGGQTVRDMTEALVDDAPISGASQEFVEAIRVHGENAGDAIAAENAAQLEAEAADEAAYEQRQADAAAELARKEAEMEAAHERGEAYNWGETTHNGETVDEWRLPDGTVILVDDDGQAVSVDYPPGAGPEFQGDMLYNGELCGVYEMPSGATVVVDSDGNFLGELDDLEPDTFYTVVPGHGGMEVYLVPTGPPTYSTQMFNAATDELVVSYDTGSQSITGHYTYTPIGSDYEYVISENGEILSVTELPAEPEWSFLGIVEYYEDGTVSVDLGVIEVDVDVIGPEKGIEVSLDLLIAEGTAGVEWADDGSWSFDVGVDVDVPGGELDVALGFGEDSDGHFFLDAEANVDIALGFARIAGGMEGHFQETDEGFEISVGMHGEFSTMGLYLSRDQELSFALDDDGGTLTYVDTIGAGVKGLGGIAITSQTQIHSDGTWKGTSGTQGAGAALVDKDGDEVLQGGVFADTEGNTWAQQGLLGDGRRQNQNQNSGIPNGPGDDAAGAGFDLSGDDADESTGMPGALQPSRDAFDVVAVADDDLATSIGKFRDRSSNDRDNKEMDASTPKFGDRPPADRDNKEMDASTPKFGDRTPTDRDHNAMDASTPKFGDRSSNDRDNKEMDASTPKFGDRPPHDRSDDGPFANPEPNSELDKSSTKLSDRLANDDIDHDEFTDLRAAGGPSGPLAGGGHTPPASDARGPDLNGPSLPGSDAMEVDLQGNEFGGRLDDITSAPDRPTAVSVTDGDAPRSGPSADDSVFEPNDDTIVEAPADPEPFEPVEIADQEPIVIEPVEIEIEIEAEVEVQIEIVHEDPPPQESPMNVRLGGDTQLAMGDFADDGD